MSKKNTRDETTTKESGLNRRNVLLAGTTLAAAALGSAGPMQTVQAQQPTQA